MCIYNRSKYTHTEMHLGRDIYKDCKQFLIQNHNFYKLSSHFQLRFPNIYQNLKSPTHKTASISIHPLSERLNLKYENSPGERRGILLN